MASPKISPERVRAHVAARGLEVVETRDPSGAVILLWREPSNRVKSGSLWGYSVIVGAKATWGLHTTSSGAEALAQATVNAHAARAKEVSDRRTARAAHVTALRPGDIMSASWGYEQTNVDFFEVTRVPSAKSVELRPIASKLSSNDRGSSMTGTVMPVRGQYTGPAKTYRVNERDSVKLNSYKWAMKWDGKPEHTSWYG